MSTPPAPEPESRSLGPALILVGTLAVLLARGIPESTLGNNQDPGPRAFPVALGWLLILGGAYEFARTFLIRSRASTAALRLPGILELRAWFTRRENRDALILIGALGLYLAALPWLGFPLSTVLFATGMMVQLGARWPRAIAVSAGLVVVIHLLFVLLFKVQLPAGVLGWSW